MAYDSTRGADEPVLSLQSVSRRYGPIQALKDVSFDVPAGSIFGVLGPNGSGKTTLLGVVMDVRQADAGTYRWFGQAPHAGLRKRIGTLLETPNFYPYYSAVQNLRITAAIKSRGEDDIERVLRLAGLWERRNSRFAGYSLGMKQRLAIAAATLGNPEVLVLDEPTNGLDPVGIAEVREFIRKLGAQGTTVIMASHLLDEVEKVCSHVVILKQGELLVSGPTAEVLSAQDGLEIGAADLVRLGALLGQWPGIQSLSRRENVFHAVLSDDSTAEQLNRYCFERGIPLNHLMMRKTSLEARFMELTG